MRFQAITAVALLAASVFANNDPPPGCNGCAADNCYWKGKLPPQWSAPVSQYCSKLIGKACTSTVTAPKTATVNRTVTVTPARATSVGTVTSVVTVTNLNTALTTNVVTIASTNINTVDSPTTATITVTAAATCTASPTTISVNAPFATFIEYRVRGSDPAPTVKVRGLDERDYGYKPSIISAGCRGEPPFWKASAACDCFIKSTVTVSPTSTRTVTVTAPAQTTLQTVKATQTQTAQVTNVVTVVVTTLQTVQGVSTRIVPTTVTVTTNTCVLTNTPSVTVTIAAAGGCGPSPASVYASSTAYGSIQCPDAASPTETPNYFRIEGASEGNIFDGCINTAPRNITTSSGGTHLCDGTNNNANPAPGGTFTTDIDAAGRQEGFGFDGSYSNQFQDFFISAISNTAQTGNQFWGVLRNRVFTARGGCQEQVNPSDEALWAFDAFAPNRVFLSTSPVYIVAQAGSGNIEATILAGNPNSGNTIPAQGAVIGGAVAGSDGSVTFPVPTVPGCYLYKAELSNAIRSNALYVNVVPAFVAAP